MAYVFDSLVYYMRAGMEGTTPGTTGDVPGNETPVRLDPAPPVREPEVWASGSGENSMDVAPSERARESEREIERGGKRSPNLFPFLNISHPYSSSPFPYISHPYSSPSRRDRR